MITLLNNILTDGFPVIPCWRTTGLFKTTSVKLQKFSIFHLTAVWSISLPNFMKFFRVVLEKHAPFPRRSRRSNNHPFAIFCSTAHALHSIGFSQPWRKSCKIPGFFASWNFLMYYSNKRLNPTTAFVIVRRNNTYGTGIEQTNCPFIGAMFVVVFLFAIFVRALPRISTSARKKLCSAALRCLLLSVKRRL